MSVGVWFALLGCTLLLAGLGMMALLLVKLDSRRTLRQVKVDARLGRWFGLAIQLDRADEDVTGSAPVSSAEPRSSIASSEMGRPVGGGASQSGLARSISPDRDEGNPPRLAAPDVCRPLPNEH